MNIFILISFLFSSLGFGQTELHKEVESEIQSLEDRLKSHDPYVAMVDKEIATASKKISDLREREETLLNYEEKLSEKRIITLSEIEDKLASMSAFQKLGKKAKFFKCLKNSLASDPFLDEKSCSNQFKTDLTSDEKDQLKDWKNKVGIPLNEVAAERAKIPNEILIQEKSLSDWQLRKKNTDSYTDYLKSEINFAKMQKEELSLLEKHKSALDCGPGSPEFNLESDGGPFHGVPRDNQDGIGSCYANAAKNLLVGISGGKDVASFLDLALIYKDSRNDIPSSGLDGGLSCDTLNDASKVGYCPQKFAPLETGERNLIGEGLFNLQPSEYLATNITLVKNFITGLSDFEKLAGKEKDEVLGKANFIIDEVKKNPNIKLPLPVVKSTIPMEWKLKEFYSLNKAKLGNVNESDFIKEYNDQYKTFYPKYIKAVLEGKKQDEIFDIYKTSMSPVIDKFNMHASLPEFKRVFLINTNVDFKDPKLRQQLDDSISFLKRLLDKVSMSNEDFFEYCAGEGAVGLNFLSGFQPVIEKIKDNKLNQNFLVDSKGKFKSAKELMQLTVAPSCLNPENRKPLPPFTCKSGYETIHKIKSSSGSEDQKILSMRQKVVMSLAQGYPLGNSYPTSAVSGHINTIVGMKYNPQSQKCEYLIRESQTGLSSWQDEKNIFKKINALTEVRKLK